MAAKAGEATGDADWRRCGGRGAGVDPDAGQETRATGWQQRDRSSAEPAAGAATAGCEQHTAGQPRGGGRGAGVADGVGDGSGGGAAAEAGGRGGGGGGGGAGDGGGGGAGARLGDGSIT